MEGHNQQLAQILERVERLEEERAEIGEMITEVLLEAKATGHDLKALKRLLRERKLKAKDADKWRQEHDAFDVMAEATKLFA